MFISLEHVILINLLLRKEVRSLACLFGCRFCFVWKLCFRQCLIVTKCIYDFTAKMTHVHMLPIYYSGSRQLKKFKEAIPAVGHSVETLTLLLVWSLIKGRILVLFLLRQAQCVA